MAGVCAASVSLNSKAANIGDPAPAVTIERWVKGAPVKVGPGTNIYVVEFWATWCPPCRESIPHLTEMQKKYVSQGVVIIGVSDEAVAEVQPFVTAQGARMDYRVAVDSSERTFNNWMKAYGESGIPHAFIVGTNGTVWWHGNPLGNLERTLERILTGRFDINREKNKETGERLVVHYTKLVSKANAAATAAPTGEKILNEYSQDWRVPYHLAEAILTDLAVKSRDVPLALRATTKAVELTARQSPQALALHGRALFASGKKDEGIAAVKEAVSTETDADDKTEFQKTVAMLEKAASMTAGKPAAKTK